MESSTGRSTFRELRSGTLRNLEGENNKSAAGTGYVRALINPHRFLHEREMDMAIDAVDRGEAHMAGLLKPVRVEQVTEITFGGRRPPAEIDRFLS